VRWPLKLIVNRPGSPELYRLDEDPGERVNLADGTREAALAEEVLGLVASLEPPDPEAPHPMSREARERLRALGYLD
jgi:hypothetical protein